MPLPPHAERLGILWRNKMSFKGFDLRDLDFREDILPIIIKGAILVVVLIIGISIGKMSKNAVYQEKITALQNELTTMQSQSESFVSVNNEDSLIMILVDDDYRFLTTSQFKAISDSLPEMKARKFILIDLKENKKIIELENQRLNDIYQELGKMEALTDPDYYVRNMAIFPELSAKKAAIEKEYMELTEGLSNGTISEGEKTRREKEISSDISSLNTEYPVNGYQWGIKGGIVSLSQN